jgi:hypothetical protein
MDLRGVLDDLRLHEQPAVPVRVHRLGDAGGAVRRDVARGFSRGGLVGVEPPEGGHQHLPGLLPDRHRADRDAGLADLPEGRPPAAGRCRVDRCLLRGQHSGRALRGLLPLGIG